MLTYEELLAAYNKLQKEVNCDYYESYLREKARADNLERQLKSRNQTSVNESSVRDIAGWEYYGD
jgi:hypothetical protein